MPQSFFSFRPWMVLGIFLIGSPIFGMLFLGRYIWAALYTLIPLFLILLVNNGTLALPQDMLANGLCAVYLIGVGHGFGLCLFKAPSTSKDIKHLAIALPLYATLILALVPALRPLFVYTFDVNANSMQPTLREGDRLQSQSYVFGYVRALMPLPVQYLAAQERHYQTTPQRGDLVIFYNAKDGVTYVKRLYGFPGERIHMKDGKPFVNDLAILQIRTPGFDTFIPGVGDVSIPQYQETLSNGVTFNVIDANVNGRTDNTPVFTVPSGHYFVLGDNRDNSHDSRTERVGFVPAENILARVDKVIRP